MCGRNSKHGARFIIVFSLLFLLLVPQCFAASSWGAFFPRRSEATESQKQEPVEVAVPEARESSQAESTMPSETSNPSNSQTSEEALEHFTQEYTNYLNEVTNYVSEVEELKNLSDKLQTQLDAYQQTDAISEVEYQAVKESLLSTVEMNNLQADKIAKLEKEAKTKAYALVGTFIGFDGGLPDWGLSATLGVRFGANVMAQVRAEYEMGNFQELTVPTLSLDNLRIGLEVGWMW